MEPLTRTLDIREELADIEAIEADIQAEIDERVDAALDIDPPSTDGEETDLARLDEEVEELEAMLVVQRGRVEALERALAEWDGTEVVLRELSGAEARSIKAQAQHRADQAGVDYTDDFHETLLLEKAVESTPPNAPPPGAIGDLPERLFDFLLARANTLNSVGEFELGNSSLRERMMDRRTGPDADSDGEPAAEADEPTETPAEDAEAPAAAESTAQDTAEGTQMQPDTT
jgi:hypothetical protein